MEQLISKYYGEIDHAKFAACKGAIDGATCCRDCCRKQYFDGNKIDYSCEQKRKVYLLRYLPVHAKEMYLAASRIPKDTLDNLFRSGSISVLSLGGGPGSDVAAIKEILIEKANNNAVTEVEILRVDVVSEWDPIALDVISLFSSDMIKFKHKKKKFDLARKVFNPERSYDIIMLSYLISELKSKDIPCLIESIKNCVNENTVILINDRFESAVTDKIHLVLYELGVTKGDIKINSEWCGVSYPDHIKDAMRPKLRTSSIQYTMVSRK